MPLRPLAYCTEPGCSVRVARGRCPAHRLTRDEHSRPNVDVRRWYRTERWSWLRRVVLRDAMYECAVCGVIDVGRDLHVDHIRPHGGDPKRFWDRANLQALCARCHQLKTMRGE